MRETPQGVVIAITHDDKAYLPRFTPALSGVAAKVYVNKIETLAQFLFPVKKAGVRHVITTRLDILARLLPRDNTVKPNIDNYAGSIIEYDGVEFLFVHPLRQLVTKSFGDFLNRRYVSKIVRPAKWRVTTEFDWSLIVTGPQHQEALDTLNECDLIGCDIETYRTPLAISCIGYCGVNLSTGTSHTYVLPIDSDLNVVRMRQLNQIDTPKVFHNGKYDIAYLTRYNAPVRAYYYDTINMLHSWYSELPKDLGSAAAFLVRDSMYWKDLAKTTDKMEYYRYNALDCWATVEAAIAWLLESPDWARNNYKTKFPLVMPSHMCEMRGLKRNEAKLLEANELAESKQAVLLSELQRGTGYPNFNPSSPKQVKQLLHILGYKKAESSNEATLVEAGTQSDFVYWFTSRIVSYRGLRKLSSTYLKTGADKSEFSGRILFALNPHGTDTGRNASKAHHFWCGLQIQNIPAGDEEGVDVKATLEADEGFDLWEADYSQAEDRGVAYKSGDQALLAIFDSGKDSHSVKSSMFFGIPYEEIYDDSTGKTLQKSVRQLGKRVNHGANYNMGAKVLLLTMGSDAVRAAQKLIGLPGGLQPIEVCKYLIESYSAAFPTVKTRYYASIKRDIAKTNKLVGDTGWTRYCFGDPEKSKQALNSYIAHITQSLNAMILDRAFMAVFNELGFDKNFKLVTQIHDSILFQVRRGHEHLAERVKELMLFPVPVTDCAGVVRNLEVPVDLTKLGQFWRCDE